MPDKTRITCKTCKFCLSPALADSYCNNHRSDFYKEKFPVKTINGECIDARLMHSCEKHEMGDDMDIDRTSLLYEVFDRRIARIRKDVNNKVNVNTCELRDNFSSDESIKCMNEALSSLSLFDLLKLKEDISDYITEDLSGRELFCADDTAYFIRSADKDEFLKYVDGCDIRNKNEKIIINIEDYRSIEIFLVKDKNLDMWMEAYKRNNFYNGFFHELRKLKNERR